MYGSEKIQFYISLKTVTIVLMLLISFEELLYQSWVSWTYIWGPPWNRQCHTALHWVSIWEMERIFTWSLPGKIWTPSMIWTPFSLGWFLAAPVAWWIWASVRTALPWSLMNRLKPKEVFLWFLWQCFCCITGHITLGTSLDGFPRSLVSRRISCATSKAALTSPWKPQVLLGLDFCGRQPKQSSSNPF